MGLLTILKKMKQKEKEVRLLMLYPQTELIPFLLCFSNVRGLALIRSNVL